MKSVRLARLGGVAACAFGLLAGCGPEQIDLKDAPPVTVPPPSEEVKPPEKGGPAPGSSGGMKTNPGAST